MPDSFLHPVAGQCRWCSEPVLDAKGNQTKRVRCWHPACVTIYRIACFSDDQRRAVRKRDNGICARCGVDSEAQRAELIRNLRQGERYLEIPTYAAWEADHIRPLVESQGRIEFFLLDNLQTLCHACHVQKGKEDRRRRRDASNAEYQQRLLTVQPQLLWTKNNGNLPTIYTHRSKHSCALTDGNSVEINRISSG